jgi:DNA-binding NtrC family response regulator
VVPLGSNRAVQIDVRLICATNMPLESLVAQGEFREDLLYRINTIEICLPPLRERLDEIPALAAHFVKLYSRKYRLPEKRLTRPALDALRAHHWPGNVRELSHAVERALILSEDSDLDARDFLLSRTPSRAQPVSLNLDNNERSLVATALDNANGNISHAATALGITRAALYRRIEKFGL